ncbi:Cto1p KNAG_0H01810 [Huiozyma naganishii CBS 8797]|uniref:Haloacid dehalogenase-like hydrolase n=1 Tax=Huiozyma naganishii (strain ATCC MYA-139 / BCRC 22969 / CBS 8797 / KCTC 17520 / NBRC 10181 / NCYC 3082 / Yp74L-3) TaxID=1071383 RepID=J7R9Q7_HUIN7|nr:hypothetical protein KNAG_0H01810 [Kazachstania naganishii CBS 8797]CCK71595.1 hypothetical protein KNAG_0H01810 [Kazachstania naganishii CBS 8797]
MRRVLISDFDETITEEDTIKVLGRLPYKLDPDFEPKWEHFSDNYMEGWSRFSVESPQRELPLAQLTHGGITIGNYKRILKSEFDYQHFNRKIELNSTNELTKCNVFQGITLEQMEHFARSCLLDGTVRIRRGFQELLTTKFDRENFYILSVNWSKEFIGFCVGEDKIDPANISCNTLKLVNGTYDGAFTNTVVTGSDKVVTLERLLQPEGKTLFNDDDIWYVGDSETDILSILHPLVNGVLLLDPSENAKKFTKITGAVLGINEGLLQDYMTNPNTEAVELTQFKKELGKKVYLVKSWEALDKLIV